MTSPIPLKPKPIEINGFKGVLAGKSDGTVQWMIIKIMTVEFQGSSTDEQAAMHDMRRFIDEYEQHRSHAVGTDDSTGDL